MNDTTKYAIGAGVGLFLWSKLRGIILFGWFLFLVFIVWASATGSFSDSSKEVVSEKKSDWENEQRMILEWANRVDLPTAALASIKEVSRPESPYYVPDWKEQVLKSERLAKCREAVHNNSPRDAYIWCKNYYDENHEN